MWMHHAPHQVRGRQRHRRRPQLLLDTTEPPPRPPPPQLQGVRRQNFQNGVPSTPGSIWSRTTPTWRFTHSQPGRGREVAASSPSKKLLKRLLKSSPSKRSLKSSPSKRLLKRSNLVNSCSPPQERPEPFVASSRLPETAQPAPSSNETTKH